MKIVIGIIALFGFLLIFSLFTSEKIDAIGANAIKQSAINPDSIFYPFKRISEKLFLNFQFTTEAKAKYYNKLLETRFSELGYIAKNKKLGQVETTSQRFAYQTGILADYLVAQNLSSDKEIVLNSFSEYRQMIPQLRDLYPANSSYWMLLQQDIDTLDLNAAKLKD